MQRALAVCRCCSHITNGGCTSEGWSSGREATKRRCEGCGIRDARQPAEDYAIRRTDSRGKIAVHGPTHQLHSGRRGGNGKPNSNIVDHQLRSDRCAQPIVRTRSSTSFRASDDPGKTPR